MKQFLIIGFLMVFILTANMLFAEEQVRKANPPSQAEQDAPAQPAPATPAPVFKADPSGANTGGAADVVGATAGAPTADDMKKLAANEPLAVKLADVIGHNRTALNVVWMLVCAYLVFFMQAGFAMVETGFTRAKNAGHTMAMNMMVFVFAVLGYWICGYAFQMGGKGFFLSGSSYDVSIITLFMSQVVYMNIAATIPTGAMAERWTFKSLVVYGFFISMFTYPLYANWVWGGGWLSQLGKNFGLGHGVLDFAGSSVVHMVGGVSALTGAIVLGPRMGKYRANGTPVAIPGHHIPMAIIGCLILFFGWFGFNSGPALAAGNLRIGVIAVNTMLASAAASFSAMLYMWIKYGKPDLSMCANGLLAGLVAITAPCAFVSTVGAVIIGLVAGVLCCASVFFVERTLKVDDPVGAVSVHGTCGAWGLIGLGLFADGTYGDGLNNVPGTVKGLFYGGASQFAAEVIGVVVNFVFVFIVMYAFFTLLNKIIPLRVSEETEFEGLDQNEVAVTAYPDFSVTKARR
ncbi:MAG: ammonium transporter [Thermodesulfovibrionales bacterium]